MSAAGPVLVITYWSWKDALIQTYTLPYVELIQKYSGKKVWLVTLEQEQHATSAAEREAITKAYGEKNIVPLFFTYKKFGIGAMFRAFGMLLQLRRLIRREKIGTIHTWCTPAGAIGYILARLTGKPLILDSFEPHAEAMVENGTWKRDSMAYRILFSFEKKQARKAKTVIALSNNMRTYSAEKYGVKPEPFYIKPALIDHTQIKHPSPEETAALKNELGLTDAVTAVYAGKAGGIYLAGEIITLLQAGTEVFGKNFRALLLSPTPAEQWQQLAAAGGFDAAQLIVKFIPQQEIYRYLALADFAINPVKPVPSKQCCTSIKDGEYWTAGLPVIITPGISDDSDIIQKNNTGVIWSGFSAAECRNAMQAMLLLLAGDRENLRERVKQQALQYRDMQIAHTIYCTIYGNNYL